MQTLDVKIERNTNFRFECNIVKIGIFVRVLKHPKIFYKILLLKKRLKYRSRKGKMDYTNF